MLVILDACHSGIALGSLIKWRDDGAWREGSLDQLRRRQSRRVITSAMDDQRAMDCGPVAGHSLFTGCLLEALTGGLARSGRLEATGSELGLYIQKRVITYPGSCQTPDFGTLEFDDRGELVIPTDGVMESREHRDVPAVPRHDGGPGTALWAAAAQTSAALVGERLSFAGRTIQNWKDDLQSPNENQRREAAWALGRIGRPAGSALPAILEVLRTGELSFELVDAIGRIAPGDERAVLPLARSLSAPEERTRDMAVELLVKHGTAALDILLSSIEDSSRRAAACVALSRIGTPAVGALLEIASLPRNEALSASVHACIGAMSTADHDEVIRIARARVHLAHVALAGLDRAAVITSTIGNFALEVWSRRLSASCDKLASMVALRGASDPDLLLPVAIAAFTGNDAELVTCATKALVIGDTGLAVMRGLLLLDHDVVVRRLLPVISALGERAGALGAELVHAWSARANKSKDESAELLLRTVMHVCPASASLDMLTLALRESPPLGTVACNLLIAAGPPGLGKLLGCLGTLSSALREKAVMALKSAASAAPTIIACASAHHWRKGTLAFCADDSSYANAAASYALTVLHDKSYARDHQLSRGGEEQREAIDVLAAAPDATLREIKNRIYRAEVIDSSVLTRIIGALKQPLDLFVSLVPLLEQEAVSGGVFTVLTAFHWRPWDRPAVEKMAAALDSVRGSRNVATNVGALRKHLRLDWIGRLTRSIGRLGFPGIVVASALGGALLFSLGLARTRKHIARALVALVVATLVLLYVDQASLESVNKSFLWFLVLNAAVSISAGVAAGIVCDFILYDPDWEIIRKCSSGIAAAVLTLFLMRTLIALAVPVDHAVAVTNLPVAGVLGAVFSLLDPD